MCGIAGVFGDPRSEIVDALIRALYHRGPDSSGYYSRGEIHLGARRLSIIDLQSGDQPIYNETRDKAVVFNGEIYNHELLRKHLEERGHVFSTRSDTEVIVHLYEDYGERCVEHLRGMFAFAIADGEKLFLARDRFGIKPLYYSVLRSGKLFLFASEIKALLRCCELGITLNMQAFADTLVLTHAVGKQTLFEGVETLEPGHTMMIEKMAGVIEKKERKYYDLRFTVNNDIGFEDAERRLADLLRATVKSHLIADVEVGVALSGGVDSSILTMIMNETSSRKIRTFTIGTFEDHPDIVNARQVCSHIESISDFWVPTFREYVEAIPRFVAAQEHHSRLRGLPCYMLCERIGRQLKVCLNGEGADELFGGYLEYVDPSFRIRYIERKMPVLRKLGFSPSGDASKVIYSLVDGVKKGSSLEGIFEINLRDSLARHHLETTDKYSMAASLEIRVPYLDHELVEFVTGLPMSFKVDSSKGIQKRILKELAINVSGGRLADIALRKKIGFPSAATSYLERFSRLCEDLLPDDYLKLHELGFCFSTKLELLSFELFSEIFFNQRGQATDDLDVLHFIRERKGLSGYWRGRFHLAGSWAADGNRRYKLDRN